MTSFEKLNSPLSLNAEESVDHVKIEKMKLDSLYEEYPGETLIRCVLITHDANFRIPTNACIHYENKHFTFESLENDENGKCVSEKWKSSRDYFENRVNKTSLEISICDAKKALLDFKCKNNFTVIYGCNPCCEGYLITKLCFDFPNNSVNIEQQSTCSCDYYVSMFDICTYTIEDNSETLSLMLSTALQYIKNRAKDSCTRAAIMGNLGWLQYAHEQGYTWGKFTCENAAYKGHLDCLKYLHENGCPWDANTCEGAAAGGFIQCLKYAREHGCPWESNTINSAALHGCLDCLQYAHENGCIWHEETTKSASRHGNFECLKYAVENGAPKHPETCRYARGNCSGPACYNYAIANGFPE